MKPAFWNDEVQQVTGWYAGAFWTDGLFEGRETRVWHLTMSPIPRADELHEILYDLDQGNLVCVGVNGLVAHDNHTCEKTADHELLLPRLKLTPVSYQVDLIYPPAPFVRGRPVQPRAKVMAPALNAATCPRHPHLYLARGDESWACPLSPQSTSWTWGPGATLAYLDQVALWLLKTVVWLATGGGILSFGKWLGPDTPHGALDLLSSVSATDPCWCGNGRSYEDCHRARDIQRAANELQR